MMRRVRPLNLGWCFFPSKVASDTPFLGRLWTDLENILVDFWSRVRLWRNFWRKEKQPKFKGRTLMMRVHVRALLLLSKAGPFRGQRDSVKSVGAKRSERITSGCCWEIPPFDSIEYSYGFLITRCWTVSSWELNINGTNSLQLFVVDFDTCLVWELLLLPSNALTAPNWPT